jgi:hypothetical protein
VLRFPLNCFPWVGYLVSDSFSLTCHRGIWSFSAHSCSSFLNEGTVIQISHEKPDAQGLLNRITKGYHTNYKTVNTTKTEKEGHAYNQAQLPTTLPKALSANTSKAL